MMPSNQIKSLDTIQGSSFPPIQAAMGTFQRHNLELSHYKILVVRENNSNVIVFTDRDGKENARQSIGVREGTNQELNPHDLSALMSNIPHLKVLDTLQGPNFTVLQAAATVFQRHVSDLKHYKIAAVREGSSFVVMFTDKDGKAGVRGNSGARPGFEVELDGRDMHVLRSNYIR